MQSQRTAHFFPILIPGRRGQYINVHFLVLRFSLVSDYWHACPREDQRAGRSLGPLMAGRMNLSQPVTAQAPRPEADYGWCLHGLLRALQGRFESRLGGSQRHLTLLHHREGKLGSRGKCPVGWGPVFSHMSRKFRLA